MLRSLVVLDTLWIIDAATSVIRDYRNPDHSDGYERMRLIDKEAVRQKPTEWEMLTQTALLKKPLLSILWSSTEFEASAEQLLDLMTRFSLFIPLPSNPSLEFLVPSLLPAATAGMPRGWPIPTHDAAQLRIFFYLEGQMEEGQLLCDTTELSNGFLPIGVFHRLCAGALGCSYQTARVIEPTLDRQHAYIAFERTLVTLTYEARESSILVTLNSDGKDGSAAAVADRLRVLLIEELSQYTNLNFCMLALLPDGLGHTWVNLEELPKTGSLPRALTIRGRLATIDLLKEEFVFWMTTECEFYFILADKLRSATDSELPSMATLQELRFTKPDWIVSKLITFKEALSGAYASEYLSLSYRWETKVRLRTDLNTLNALPLKLTRLSARLATSQEHPDPDAVQLRVLQAHLRSHTTVRFVFVDYMCLAQGKRLPKDKAEFKMMLPNINLLYLGTSVLVLMFDKTYMERFWVRQRAYPWDDPCVCGCCPFAWLADSEARASRLANAAAARGVAVFHDGLRAGPCQHTERDVAMYHPMPSRHPEGSVPVRECAQGQVASLRC